MRPTEAVQYLPQRGLHPLMEVECAGTHCPNCFMLGDATAFPARFGEDVYMAFFCSEICYLAEISPNQCGTA
jgi:hypothetical protein